MKQISLSECGFERKTKRMSKRGIDKIAPFVRLFGGNIDKKQI